MRLLSIALVFIFIFYLGVQAGTTEDFGISKQVIHNESQIEENNQQEESFLEKHQSILTSAEEENGSQLFGIAMFLEDVVKKVFSVLFQFFYRFSSMFF